MLMVRCWYLRTGEPNRHVLGDVAAANRRVSSSLLGSVLVCPILQDTATNTDALAPAAFPLG
jgi:hypothetical protein